ncbi:MAG: hypothetical protein ACFFCQ_11055 [Promethearchaeota archaeon]
MNNYSANKTELYESIKKVSTVNKQISNNTVKPSPSPFKSMILFTSSDCMYCNQARKVTKHVASQLGNQLVEYDVFKHSKLVDVKKIGIVPTLLIGDGKKEQRVIGAGFSEGEVIKAVFNASVR